jgi:hypothetical protein
MMSTSCADRVVITSSALVVLFAVVARVHDVTAYPAIYDFDASGHATNVVDLLELHLPNPRSWCGSHPPLYYAIGAVLWRLLPQSVPVHVTLRLLSAGAWVATVGLIWRSLRRLASEADAAVVGALLLGVPGIVIVSCMMTNDALCALFVTGAVVRLLEAPGDGALDTRHAAFTAVLAGLAAMTKATGIAAIGMAAGFYAWRSRHSPSRALLNVLVVGLVSAAIAGPHYARLFSSLAGSPYHILGGIAGSQEKEAIGAVVLAAAPGKELFPSLPALFHASMWGDPTAVFLPHDPRIPFVALSWAGLVVMGVCVAGAVHLLVNREIARRSGVGLIFGLLYAAPLVPPLVAGPFRYFLLTKPNFLLPEVLPIGIVLAVGLGGLSGGFRTALRGALLIIAAGGIAVTWYGWWEPARPVSRAIELHHASPGSAVLAVDRYFEYRAHDPIRAVPLLAPEAQLAHGLRLVRILRLPLPPERGLTPQDERSLELARARVAWLELYNLVRWIQPMAAALDVSVVEVQQQRDAAEVHVRIGPSETTAPWGTSGIGLWPFRDFDQHFTLQRAGGEWKITSIDQSGVADDNAVQAFVAYPTLAALEHLRALGWRPSWEDTIDSVIHRSS